MVGRAARRAREDQAEGSSIQEKSAILRVFKDIDADGSGKVGPKELANAIRRLTGYSVTQWEAESIVDAMDADGDGSVSYSEFANKLLEAGAKAADDAEKMEE